MGTRMRNATKIEWSVIAVADPSPQTFAAKLQGVLQQLTDDGYSIVSQMGRGEALIVTAQRPHQNQRALVPSPRSVVRTSDTTRHRVVEMPQLVGEVVEEVLYYYVENKEQKHLAFKTLLEALRVVEPHLAQGADVLPIKLVSSTLTYFGPPSFVPLLRLFAEELRLTSTDKQPE
jgi:hypothetical protein